MKVIEFIHLEETKKIEKYVKVRQFKKPTGTQIKLPNTIEELLKIGKELFDIQAVKVRDTVSDVIIDIEGIKDGDVLYLTTEENEKEFK